MENQPPSSISNRDTRIRLPLWAFALMLAISARGLLLSPVHAQTFEVIHYFQGVPADGDYPAAGLIMDGKGNFYGTARSGGPFYTEGICDAFSLVGCGDVFKMSKQGSDWVVTPMFFFDGPDGAYPMKPVTLGPDGDLYGSTGYGGRSCVPDEYGCGTIFRLSQLAAAGQAVESVIFSFPGGDNGGPLPNGVTFDKAGRMYGSSGYGGVNNLGVVFEFTGSGNTWTQSLIYSFTGGNDGAGPGRVIADASGNHLLGVTGGGGGGGSCVNGCGTVFELTRTGSGWTETILHAFNGSDGAAPSGVTLGKDGNLYGTTKGDYDCPATIWELSRSHGGWTFNVLYTFNGEPTEGPYGGVTPDEAGNLYGTTYLDGPYRSGNVYRLTHSQGGWVYTDLHDFTGGDDGGEPMGDVILDSAGNLYGTTSYGGTFGFLGVIWEITP